MRSALLVSVLALVFACEAKINAVRVPVRQGKEAGVEIAEYRGDFGTCAMNLKYTLADGRVRNRKWGEYFFGLQLGYTERNSGWDKWNFLEVHARTAKGVRNVLAGSRPVLFTGYSTGGADCLVADWEAEGGGRIRLRFAAFPSQKGWLFLRVESADIPLARIRLNARPGSAAVVEGREMHIASKGRDWNLAAESAEFKPEFTALLLYSRYVFDHFGNKLVFDAEPVAAVKSGKCASQISVDFTLAKGAKHADFALGFFANRDAEDQVVRFLGEDCDTIHSFLKAIDWEAVPGLSDFRLAVRIALQMGVDRQVLKALSGRYMSARQAHDVVSLVGCEAELAELRRKRTEEGLRELEDRSR